MNNPVAGVFIFITGSVFASFFGVVICRVPKGQSIAYPGSHCFGCGRFLSWYENIPIVSWLLSGGKCRNCGSKIGVFSFVYEILGGIVPTLVYSRASNITVFAVCAVVSLILLLIAGYDYENRELSTLFGKGIEPCTSQNTSERFPFFTIVAAVLYLVILVLL